MIFLAGIVSASLWDSKTSTFAGLLTTSDYINVIQYFAQNPEAINTPRLGAGAPARGPLPRRGELALHRAE